MMKLRNAPGWQSYFTCALVGCACGLIVICNNTFKGELLIAFALVLPIVIVNTIRRQRGIHAVIANLFLGITFLIRIWPLPRLVVPADGHAFTYIFYIMLITLLPVGFVELIRLVVSRARL